MAHIIILLNPARILKKTNEGVYELIFEKVKELLCDNLGIDENDVTMDANLIDDLNIDSLDVVELIMAVEEEFGIEIPESDVEKVSTVGGMVDYISGKI